MEDLTDFIADFLQPDYPKRDNSGRPLLIPRGVPVTGNPDIDDPNRVPYTRASGLGDLLEEFSYLWKWKMRGLAKGLADRMDLVRLVAAEQYTCGFTDNIQANRAAGRRIDEVIDRALDQAGVDMKADYGTAVHSRTEPGNDELDPDEMQAADVASCWDLWTELGVTHLGTEIFTACDETRSAGTFDHLSYVPGLGIVITDKKTSSKAKATYDVQLGGYSRSDVYDPETDVRMTLEEYIEAQGWDPRLLNRSVGVIWWVKGGRTQARFLNLDQGFQAAKVAAWIRDERRTMGVATDGTPELKRRVSAQRDELLRAINNAGSIDVLMNLWNNPAAQSIWAEQHTAAATARREELS